MVKIRAKQILDGKTARAFFSLLFPKALSLVSLALTGAVLYLASLDETVEYTKKYLGEYAYIGVIVLSVILCCFFLFLFAIGKKLFYSHLAKLTKKMLITDCSGAFKTLQFLVFSAVRFLFVLAWAGLYLFPASVVTALAYYFVKSGEMTVGMFNIFMSGGAVLTASGLFFTFVTVQRYSLWGLALCKRGAGVFSALDVSIKKTEERMTGIAFFKISMLPWIVLSFLILPSVYVLPYYETAVALKLLGSERKTEKTEMNKQSYAAVFTV